MGGNYRAARGTAWGGLLDGRRLVHSGAALPTEACAVERGSSAGPACRCLMVGQAAYSGSCILRRRRERTGRLGSRRRLWNLKRRHDQREPDQQRSNDHPDSAHVLGRGGQLTKVRPQSRLGGFSINSLRGGGRPLKTTRNEYSPWPTASRASYHLATLGTDRYRTAESCPAVSTYLSAYGTHGTGVIELATRARSLSLRPQE